MPGRLTSVDNPNDIPSFKMRNDQRFQAIGQPYYDKALFLGRVQSVWNRQGMRIPKDRARFFEGYPMLYLGAR